MAKIDINSVLGTMMCPEIAEIKTSLFCNAMRHILNINPKPTSSSKEEAELRATVDVIKGLAQFAFECMEESIKGEAEMLNSFSLPVQNPTTDKTNRTYCQKTTSNTKEIPKEVNAKEILEKKTMEFIKIRAPEASLNDPRSVLGVVGNEIKKAYHKRAREFHPDKAAWEKDEEINKKIEEFEKGLSGTGVSMDSVRSEAFRKINEAYEELK